MTAVSDQRGVLKDSAWVTVGLAVSQGASLVLFIWAARDLGPSPFGRAMSVYALAAFGVGVLDFGFNAWLTRALAADRIDLDEFGDRIRARMWVVLGLVVGYAAATLVVGSDSPWGWLAVSFAALGSAQFGLVPLRAARRTRWVASSMIIERVVAIAVFAAAVGVDKASAPSVLVALACGSSASFAVSVAGWSSRLRAAIHARWRCDFRLWRGTVHLGIGSFITNAQSLDVVIVGAAAGASQAGAYGAASRAINPLLLPATAAAQASFPHFASAETEAEARRHLGHALRPAGLNVVLLIAVVVAAPWVVPFLLGSAYEDSVRVLQILAVSLIPTSLSVLLSSFLSARHREREVALVVSAAVVLQLTLVWVFALAGGADGAAFGYLAAQMSLLPVLAWRAYRAQPAPADLAGTRGASS